MKTQQYNAARNMAARKVQKAFKAYKLRKAKFTKPQQAAVAAIAKRTVFKAAETKSYINTRSHLPLDGNYTALNLNWPLAQTTSDVGIIGEKMHLKNIRFRFVADINNVSNSTTKLCRVVIFRRAGTPIAAGASPVLITPTDVFRNPADPKVTLAHVDTHKVDVLYDYQFTLNKMIESNIFQQKVWECNIPINRDEYYNPVDGTLKNGDYYILYGAWDNSLTGNPSRLTYTYALNFKDL